MEDPLMKKLLLTVAVATFALTTTTTVFAVEGKDGRTERPRTDIDKKEDGKKVEQAGTARDATVHSQATAAASNFIEVTRSASGTAKKTAQDRLAQGVKDGILSTKLLDTLAQNSGKELANNYSQVITEAALNNLLRKDSNNAAIQKKAAAAIHFGDIEVVNVITGKTTLTPEAEAKMNIFLIETARAIKDGQTTDLEAAFDIGLKKAGFSDERINEIKKECLKLG
jgi:hypothetical protein